MTEVMTQKIEEVSATTDKKKQLQPTTFRVKIATLRDFCEKALPVSDEIKLLISDKGIKAVIVDPSHETLVKLEIPLSNFEEYDIGDIIESGWPIKKILGFLKIFPMGQYKNKPIDVLVYKEKLILWIDNIKRSMATLDTKDMPTPKIPNLSLSVAIELDKENMKTIGDFIKNAGAITDIMEFKHKKRELQLISHGDIDSGISTIKTNDATEAKSTFQISWVNGIYRAIKASDAITLKIGNDYPIIISGQSKHGISFSYLIAPYLTNSDDSNQESQANDNDIETEEKVDTENEDIDQVTEEIIAIENEIDDTKPVMPDITDETVKIEIVERKKPKKSKKRSTKKAKPDTISDYEKTVKFMLKFCDDCGEDIDGTIICLEHEDTLTGRNYRKCFGCYARKKILGCE